MRADLLPDAVLLTLDTWNSILSTARLLGVLLPQSKSSFIGSAPEGAARARR